MAGPYRIGPLRIGTPICEDAWHPDVAETLDETGAEILFVPNGSPYHRDKLGSAAEPDGGARGRDRAAADLSEHGRRAGRSGVRRRLLRAEPRRRAGDAAAAVGRGGVAHVDLEEAPGRLALPDRASARRSPMRSEQDYHAMVLALRDYLRKTGFSKVLLGLSGGIDSALVAAIAADALGPGERALRDAAVGIHLARARWTMPRRWPRRWAAGWTRCRSPGARDGGRGRAGAAVRGHRRPTSPRKTSSRGCAG